MSWPRFLFWNAAGAIVWASAVGLLAYFGGKALANAVSRYGLYGAVAIGAVAVLLVAVRTLVSRHRTQL
jgi:membrane protein DedA with SNARE-associated domain